MKLVLEILQFKVIFPILEDAAIFLILSLVPIKKGRKLWKNNKCNTRISSKWICLKFYRFIEFVSTSQLVFKNLLPWQLKREQWLFVEKTKANCLYQCIDNFSIRDNAICQLSYNWSEISAKYRLLSIDNRFCHFKQKAIVLVLVFLATEFRRKMKSCGRILLICKVSNRSDQQLSFSLCFSGAAMTLIQTKTRLKIKKMATSMFVTLSLDISRTSWHMYVSDSSFFIPDISCSSIWAKLVLSPGFLLRLDHSLMAFNEIKSNSTYMKQSIECTSRVL